MKITIDISNLTTFLSDLPSELAGIKPAVVDCMGDLYYQEAVDTASDSFESLSQYTLDGFRTDYGDGWVSVYIKDTDDAEGRAVSRWMKPNILGGSRATKGFERRLSDGQYFIPIIDIDDLISAWEGTNPDLSVIEPDPDKPRNIRAVSPDNVVSVIGFILDESPQYQDSFDWFNINPEWIQPTSDAIDEVFNGIDL